MTCTDAIAEVFADERGALTARQVIARIYGRHPDRPWKENTIQLHLVGLSLNHPSNRHHPSLRRRAFLYYLVVHQGDPGGQDSPPCGDTVSTRTCLTQH